MTEQYGRLGQQLCFRQLEFNLTEDKADTTKIVTDIVSRLFVNWATHKLNHYPIVDTVDFLGISVFDVFQLS